MNKYLAKRTGKFHSQGEAKRHAELLLLYKAGKISFLTTQEPFILQESFIRNGKKIQAIRYVMDFTYIENDKRIAEDYKGFQTYDNSIKQKMFLKKYPEWVLRISGSKKKDL